MKALNKPFLFILFFLLVGGMVLAQELAGTNGGVVTSDNIGIPAESDEYLFYNSCVSGCSSCESRCKDSSLQQYAENKRDVSVCDKLSNEQLNNFCKDNINSAIAVSSRDKDKCNAIQDEDVKNSCMFVIAQQQAVESGKTDACNTLPENLKNSCINSVYFQLAQKNKDESFCNKLPKEQKTECISAIPVSELGVETKSNLSIILLIIGGIVILSGIFVGVYFIIKRKKVQEAPLLFNQQQQPSQLAQGMVQDQVQQDNKSIDLNRLQEALKKVGK